MKIKTQLYLLPGSVAALAVVLSGVLLWTWGQFNLVAERERHATEIKELIIQMDSAFRTYVHEPNPKHVEQWRAQQQRLSFLLNHAPSYPATQQTLHNSIRGLNRGVNVLFDRFQTQASSGNKTLESHIKQKLMIQLEAIYEDSYQLMTISHNTLRQDHLNQLSWMGGLLLMGSALVLVLAQTISGRIRLLLTLLKRGVKEVGEKAYEDSDTHRKLKKFGDFAEELHDMQTLLEETTISRDLLQKEIDERTFALKHIASTDPLTQVYNRRKLQEQADLEIARSSRHGEPLSVMIMDVDHFKLINDTHGHSVGDQILIHLCRLTEDVMRENDLIARYGGEEFVILMPHTDIEGGRELASRIQANLKDLPFKQNGSKIPLTISIGLATWHEEESFSELLCDADKALYRAKNAGRNCIRTFEHRGSVRSDDAHQSQMH